MSNVFKCPVCGNENLAICLTGKVQRKEGNEPYWNRPGGYMDLVEVQYVESVGCGNSGCGFFIYHTMAEKRWKELPLPKKIAKQSQTDVEKFIAGMTVADLELLTKLMEEKK